MSVDVLEVGVFASESIFEIMAASFCLKNFWVFLFSTDQQGLADYLKLEAEWPIASFKGRKLEQFLERIPVNQDVNAISAFGRIHDSLGLEHWFE